MRNITFGWILFFLFGFFLSRAQVAVDGVSDVVITSPTQTFSFDHTCNGNQRVLFLSVISSMGVNPLSAIARYNGVPMMPVWFSAIGTQSQAVWMLTNPAVGTNAISVYLPYVPDVIVSSAVSFTGADTLNPVGAKGGITDANDTCSVQLSTYYNNSTLLFFGGTPSCGSASNLSFGQGQTSLFSLDNLLGPEAGTSVMQASLPGDYTLFESGHCASGTVFGFAVEVKSADAISASNGAASLTDASLNLYPNPAAENLTIRASSVVANGMITITDLSGKVVFTDSFNGDDKRIDISALAGGVYFLRLNSLNGIAEKKFVKF